MKRLLAYLALTLLILINAVALSACVDEPVNEIVATYGEEIEERYCIGLKTFTYGDDKAIRQEISKVKFYGILEDNSKKEIPLRKFKITYEHKEKTYEKQPDKFVTGEWAIKLDYQGKEYCVYVDVEQSRSGVFTLDIQRKSWKYGEELPKLSIKNPEGKFVKPVTAGDLAMDDTEMYSNSSNCLGFKKEYYNSLGEEKYSIDYLWDTYNDLYHRDYIVRDYYNKNSYIPGEYVLVYFDMIGSYNYTDIVCSVEFTVTD